MLKRRALEAGMVSRVVAGLLGPVLL